MQFRTDQRRMEIVMKTRLFKIWRVSLLVAAIPVLGGCVQSSATDTAKVEAQPTNTPVATPPTAEPDKAVVEVSENAPPPAQAEPAPGSESKPLPADLKLSPKTSEIVKLAQGGVSENVMLAFVTNSAGTFNLGSDQIVYLNDLGVGSEVITSMIEHDRLLREGGGALPPTASGPAVAVPADQYAQPDAATIAAAAAPQAIEQPQATATEAPPAPATTEAVPAPPANVTYNYFYDSLSPYGTWVEVDGYGRCWQPSVVVLQSGWRPYCQGGRWIYSDYGWYWQSDYSWGWAPFHYGRWFSHSRWGWCWRPDTIWGPSWVSWRYTDAYCGWAPLPPAAFYSPGFGFSYYGRSVGMSFGFGLGWDCFSFVSWGHFRDHRPYRHCAPAHLAHDLHRHSTVVNHFEVGRNRTIINRGIAPDRVSRFTRTELRPVHVREEGLAGRSSRLTPGDRLERGGRELVIRRPQIPQLSAPPVTAKSGRAEPRSTSAASFSDRRAAFEPRATASPREVAPRTRDFSPARLTQDSAKPIQTPSVAARSSSPTAPTRVAAPTVRPGTPARSTVTTIGRRQTTPAASVNTQARIASERTRPNTTTTWTRPSNPRPNVAVNNPPSAPVPTQRSIQSTARPTLQAPATVAPRTYTAPAPSPSVRSAPRWSAPAPSASPTFSRPSSPPAYSPPVTRSAPAPSYTPRPAPSAPSAAPAPRSSPAPSSPPSSGGGRSDGVRGQRPR